jgi:hypothetical protein
MSRFKLALLTVSVVGAASAGVTSSAAASEYFVEGKALTESKEITGAIGTAVVITSNNGKEMAIGCIANAFGAKGNFIEAKGKSVGEFTLNACAVFRIEAGQPIATNCTVAEPIGMKYADALVAGPGGPVEDEVFAKAGRKMLLTELTVNNCAGEFNGKYKINNEYQASIPGGAIEATEHEFIFTTTGSKWLITEPGGKSVAGSLLMRISRVKLLTGQVWRVE